ncbi:MAG: GatB/YqeY domain-containing protein [Holophagaceae bacterium]|nr:GatB/YqeY domain-containing protein [Holophagaceae bacterium]
MLDRIQADLKASMLAKDALRTQTLRMALSAYRNEAVAKGLGPQGALSEADAVQVIKRLVKSREDSVEQFAKAGHLDRAAAEQAEIALLKPTCPPCWRSPARERRPGSHRGERRHREEGHGPRDEGPPGRPRPVLRRQGRLRPGAEPSELTRPLSELI